MPKRSSDIMADELKKKKKKRAEQDFHLQFSIYPDGASRPPDNRLQPVSAIALPVTNIKQL